MSRFVFLLTAAFVLQQGRATAEDALESLNSTLAKIRVLNEADLLSDEHGPRFAATLKFVRGQQCAAGTANPLVVISPAPRIDITGTMAPSGEMRISRLGARDVKDTAVKPFAIPLRVSNLTAFPNEYLKESAALLHTPGIPTDLAQKLQADVAATYEKLNARIQTLVNGYDALDCPKRVPVEPFWFFVPPTF